MLKVFYLIAVIWHGGSVVSHQVSSHHSTYTSLVNCETTKIIVTRAIEYDWPNDIYYADCIEVVFPPQPIEII